LKSLDKTVDPDSVDNRDVNTHGGQFLRTINRFQELLIG